jgi:electron transfer flavoprotein beta subunit
VKYVPDATADRQFEEDNTVDRVGVDGLLSELDEYAVEQALQLKEKAGEGEHTVTALCVGPEKAVDAARKALQMGADKAVHVLDDAIAGSDYMATSLVLAKAIEKIGAEQAVDLIVCGMASTDASGSVVPAMLAERLGLPQVTLASVVESQGDQIRIKRDNEGSTEVIGATLPIVLSVTDQSGDARYPSFKGIMAAKKKPVTTMSLADAGIDPALVGLGGAATEVADHTQRPPRQAGTIVKDDGDGGVKVAEAQRITRGGFGVFELGLRFSAIDLDDDGIRGGIERDGTVGLSWYPDTNIRIMADYVRSHTSPSALQNGRTIDADTFIGRFQLYW